MIIAVITQTPKKKKKKMQTKAALWSKLVAPEKQEPDHSIDPSQNYRSPCLNEWWSCRSVSLTWQAAALKKKPDPWISMQH